MLRLAKCKPPCCGYQEEGSALRQETQEVVDFIHNESGGGLAPQADQLRVIRSELSRQLSIRQDNDQVREKLAWLARYFNLVLSETGIQGINPLSASE